MTGLDFTEFGHAFSTLVAGICTAGAEGAAGGSVQRRGNIAFQNNALVCTSDVGVGNGNCGDKSS